MTRNEIIHLLVSSSEALVPCIKEFGFQQVVDFLIERKINEPNGVPTAITVTFWQGPHAECWRVYLEQQDPNGGICGVEKVLGFVRNGVSV